jgi:hypothetical protein
MFVLLPNVSFCSTDQAAFMAEAGRRNPACSTKGMTSAMKRLSPSS